MISQHHIESSSPDSGLRFLDCKLGTLALDAKMCSQEAYACWCRDLLLRIHCFLQLSNSSLLDEATAAAEAMTMCSALARGKKDKFLVSVGHFCPAKHTTVHCATKLLSRVIMWVSFNNLIQLWLQTRHKAL